MLSKDNVRPSQIQMISADQLVPEDHLLRKIDKYAPMKLGHGAYVVCFSSVLGKIL